jgi:hypothetical protein
VDTVLWEDAVLSDETVEVALDALGATRERADDAIGFGEGCFGGLGERATDEGGLEDGCPVGVGFLDCRSLKLRGTDTWLPICSETTLGLSCRRTDSRLRSGVSVLSISSSRMAFAIASLTIDVRTELWSKLCS